jgi:nitrilase
MTKAAIAQIEPIWYDLASTVSKTIATILSAGKDDIALLGFPEIFIPGFPHFLAALSIADGGTLCQHYHTQSMSLHGPEMIAIRKACKQAGVWVVLGFSEKTASGTLNMSQVIISSEGRIEMHRQKLKPSHYERMLFGDGGAPGVMNVVETPFGRVGFPHCLMKLLLDL